MTEKSILFSGPMVRAIIEGRKTQTRRLIIPQPKLAVMNHRGSAALQAARKFGLVPEGKQPIWKWGETFFMPWPEAIRIYAPIQKGHRLWVRETWFPRIISRAEIGIEYKADKEIKMLSSPSLEIWAKALSIHRKGKFYPSIYMPRWASRITLEVTGVWIERLQDISSEDAIKEGIEHQHCSCPITSFQTLWDLINAKRAPWKSNPWVWVIEFGRVPE